MGWENITKSISFDETIKPLNKIWKMYLEDNELTKLKTKYLLVYNIPKGDGNLIKHLIKVHKVK